MVILRTIYRPTSLHLALEAKVAHLVATIFVCLLYPTLGVYTGWTTVPSLHVIHNTSA